MLRDNDDDMEHAQNEPLVVNKDVYKDKNDTNNTLIFIEYS